MGIEPRDRADLASVFTVAQARLAGWTRSEIGQRRLERPFHGLRALPPLDRDAMTVEQAHLHRLHAFATAMSDGEFVSRASAIVAWGLPAPGHIVGADVHIGVHLPHRAPRGKGVAGHAVDRRLVRVVDHPDFGFRVASPASTWAMAAAFVAHPYDLVALGDAIVRSAQHPSDLSALASIEQLSAAVGAGRRIGVPALRAALPRVRDGASSRPETWTRLTLIDAGLPEPQLALEVFDRGGSFIGRVDAAYPQWRIAIEYEGEHHRTDHEQWSRDILRYERLAAEGWTVIRVTKDELFERPLSVVGRVRRAIAAAS